MLNTKNKKPWDRAILLVDLNAFYSSIEQLDFPELRGVPVAVTNGEQGTCIITSSYEARRYGVKTGMKLYEAKKICPHLVQRASRPDRYAEISTKIMASLDVITPDIEIFSVDEAFLDVTRCQQLYGTPEKMAMMAKKTIFDTTGLLCSVGVSGDKTTAKYAAKLNKPDGLTVIPPWEAEATLANVPVTDLCGIATGIGNYLGKHGVVLCKDMKTIPVQVLTQRFGHLGRRIWLMAQAKDPDPVLQKNAYPKSVGHGKVLPPRTNNKNIITTYLRHMSEKVALRLRNFNLEAQKYYITLNTVDGKLCEKLKLESPSNDGKDIYKLCCLVLNEYWSNEIITQVQVTALDPQATGLQLELFTSKDPEREAINKVMDTINQRYGEFTLAPARLLNRSSMSNVIAPAWRPDGIKRSV